MPGINGQKMSKSYGNTIEIFAPEKAIRKKIMSIVTDTTPVEAPKNPENSIIYSLYKFFAQPEQTRIMAEKFLAGGYGYGDAKKELFEVVWNYFAPFRSRREELSKDPGLVTEIRKKGAQSACSRIGYDG